MVAAMPPVYASKNERTVLNLKSGSGISAYACLPLQLLLRFPGRKETGC